MTLEVKMKERGIYIKDFYNYGKDKRTLLNNCVDPELGLYILNVARGIHNNKNIESENLFNQTTTVR